MTAARTGQSIPHWDSNPLITVSKPTLSPISNFSYMHTDQNALQISIQNYAYTYVNMYIFYNFIHIYVYTHWTFMCVGVNRDNKLNSCHGSWLTYSNHTGAVFATF